MPAATGILYPIHRHNLDCATQPERFATGTRLDERFHEPSIHGPMRLLGGSSFGWDQARIGTMAKWRQAVELALSDEDIAKLTAISRSRTERKSRVDRA